MSATDENKKVDFKFWNIIIVFIGIAVIILHLVLYMFSKDFFNLIVSMYGIAFAIIFMVFLQKKKDYTTAREYNFLTYLTFFILCVEIMVMILTVLSLFGIGRSSSPYAYRGGRKRT